MSKKDASSLSGLKNLGSKSAKMLNEVGIYSKQDIIDLGPANVYRLLKDRGYNVTLVMAYALEGAITDTHWNKIPKEVKERLNIDCKIQA